MDAGWDNRVLAAGSAGDSGPTALLRRDFGPAVVCFAGDGLPAAFPAAAVLVVDGFVADAFVVDGFVVDGLVVDGFVVDAFVVDGLVVDGLVVDGFVADGFVADGLVADGLVADGLVADGLVADGLVADGFVVDGFVVDGLAADGPAADALLAGRWAAVVFAAPDLAAAAFFFVPPAVPVVADLFFAAADPVVAPDFSAAARVPAAVLSGDVCLAGVFLTAAFVVTVDVADRPALAEPVVASAVIVEPPRDTSSTNSRAATGILQRNHA